MAIFIVQGALIGFIGTAIGVAGGVLLAVNIGTVVPFIERMLNIQFLDKSIYYISDLPSDLQRADVITIAGHRAVPRADRHALSGVAGGARQSGGRVAL